jgi:hypothetical protein
MKPVYRLALIGLLVVSCSTKDSFKTISVNDEYEVRLPSFLTKVSNLNDDASLQYQHAWRNIMVLVIDESKHEFHDAITSNNLIDQYSIDLSGYLNIVIDNYRNNFNAITSSSINDTTSGNMKTKTVNMSATVDGDNLHLKIAAVEGVKKYYQIIIITSRQRAHEYSALSDTIVYSFREKVPTY